MAKVILRRQAIEDLNNIWDYTFEKWSEKQADKYYSIIKMACNWIGENPNIGKEYEGISENLHGLKCEKHIVFFRMILVHLSFLLCQIYKNLLIVFFTLSFF